MLFRARRLATDTPLPPGEWLERVEKSDNGENARVILSGADQADEYLMMGLRLSEGISLDRYEALNDSPLQINEINALQEISMIEIVAGKLRATQAGRPVLNSIISELLASTDV